MANPPIEAFNRHIHGCLTVKTGLKSAGVEAFFWLPYECLHELSLDGAEALITAMVPLTTTYVATEDFGRAWSSAA
jgi:hypothetical protein